MRGLISLLNCPCKPRKSYVLHIVLMTCQGAGGAGDLIDRLIFFSILIDTPWASLNMDWRIQLKIQCSWCLHSNLISRRGLHKRLISFFIIITTFSDHNMEVCQNLYNISVAVRDMYQNEEEHQTFWKTHLPKVSCGFQYDMRVLNASWWGGYYCTSRNDIIHHVFPGRIQLVNMYASAGMVGRVGSVWNNRKIFCDPHNTPYVGVNLYELFEKRSFS